MYFLKSTDLYRIEAFIMLPSINWENQLSTPVSVDEFFAASFGPIQIRIMVFYKYNFIFFTAVVSFCSPTPYLPKLITDKELR